LCTPGLDVGWKTMLVAELAERSSREGGRPFRLVTLAGEPVATAAQAAALCAGGGTRQAERAGSAI
jgi:hypothetical protein